MNLLIQLSSMNKYSKKYQFFIFLLLFSIFSSCIFQNEKNQKKSSPDEIEISGLKEPVLQVDLVFDDTITTKYQNGMVTYKRELPDTLKFGSEDERFLILYVNYFPNLENPNTINEKYCDTFVAYSKKFLKQQPLQIKFKVKNDSLRGLNYLRGKLVDQIFLHSYSDSGSVRMLEDVTYFNKSVYIDD